MGFTQNIFLHLFKEKLNKLYITFCHHETYPENNCNPENIIVVVEHINQLINPMVLKAYD
jgi:hypothetical protein